MRILGINLADGVQPRHMWAYLVVAFFSSGYAGALAVLQPGVLQVMGIPFAEQATVTGMLSAMQEVVLISTMGLVGVWADRAGRPIVYVAGLLLTTECMVTEAPQEASGGAPMPDMGAMGGMGGMM